MTTVTTEFVYYDNGCFPTVHPVGEVVADEVAGYALSQGFAVDDSAAEPAKPAPGKRGGK